MTELELRKAELLRRINKKIEKYFEQEKTWQESVDKGNKHHEYNIIGCQNARYALRDVLKDIEEVL